MFHEATKKNRYFRDVTDYGDFAFFRIALHFPSLIFLVNKHTDKLIENDRAFKVYQFYISKCPFQLAYTFFITSLSDIQSLCLDKFFKAFKSIVGCLYFNLFHLSA